MASRKRSREIALERGDSAAAAPAAVDDAAIAAIVPAAGEAAAAFIAAASFEAEGAPVFDLNGRCETLEDGLAIVKELAPDAEVSCSGPEFPFPADLDESALRAFVPEYPSISLTEGVRDTFNGFAALKAEGRLPSLPE